jgi:hypothetical protein
VRVATVIVNIFITVVVISFASLQEESYAQTNLVTADDTLISNALTRIKSVVANNRLGEVVVWKIEADEKKSLNVKTLSTKLNFALMDAGLLKEQALDFTDTESRDELKRIAPIYGISAFIYGKRTVVEGEVVKVSFQILDSSSFDLLWEGVISSEKPLPRELALTLYYGKWVSLGTGAAAGVGAIATLVLALDAYSNKYLNATSAQEVDKAVKEVATYQSWSIGLGIGCVVSGAVAAYLFLTDRGEVVSQAGFYLPDSIFTLRPQPGGVAGSIYLRF